MTEKQADKAHAVWQELYTALRAVAHETMDNAKLNAEQREYVENKLHEELRYWR